MVDLVCRRTPGFGQSGPATPWLAGEPEIGKKIKAAASNQHELEHLDREKQKCKRKKGFLKMEQKQPNKKNIGTGWSSSNFKPRD